MYEHPPKTVKEVAKDISEALYQRRGTISVAFEQQMTAWITALEDIDDKNKEPLRCVGCSCILTPAEYCWECAEARVYRGPDE